MWVFTTFGFFSIVAHRSKPEHLLVRGRVKTDLTAFVERLPKKGRPKVMTDKTADYFYRAVVPRKAVGKLLAELVEHGLGYDNFKTAVALTQGGGRERVYHDVWADLLSLQQCLPGIRSRR